MKEKKITLKVNGITQRQWSTLLLELNIMKKAWKRFGVNIDMSAPGLKAIINLGTKTNEYVDLDKIANDYWKTKDPELKKLWYKRIKIYAYYCTQRRKVFGKTNASTKS